MPEMNPPEGPQSPQPSGKSKPWPNVWMITTFAVLAIFAASMFITSGGITGAFSATVSPQQAGQNTINFINNKMLAGQATATLVNVTEKNGLYLVNFKIENQTYSAFVTKDSRYLLQMVADMNKASTPATSVTKSNTPIVQFFVMSFCPYGQQAEAGLKPVAELLGSKAIFEPHYVIYNGYCGYGMDPSTCKASDFAQYCLVNESYCSLHGVAEVKEDVRQMAIFKLYPDKFWTYVDYVNTNTNVGNIETTWKDAAKAAGIDAAKVEDYVKANGISMLDSEVALNKQFGVQGSPTIFINGVSYNGGRAASDFQAAICNAFTTVPSECSQTLNSTASSPSGSCTTG